MTAKKASWAQTQRQSFIWEKLRNAGNFNRYDLTREFGVSTAQASIDIANFLKVNPGVMAYDKGLKVYIYQGTKDVDENGFEKIGDEIYKSLCANNLTGAAASFITDLALRIRKLESKS